MEFLVLFFNTIVFLSKADNSPAISKTNCGKNQTPNASFICVFLFRNCIFTKRRPYCVDCVDNLNFKK